MEGGDSNMNIKIYDLCPSSKVQMLNELSLREMRTIKGGIQMGEDENTATRNNFAEVMKEVNGNIAIWRTEIDETLKNLRQGMNF
ncbi:hypothetical protein [Anabaena sp. PCC 7108]|uniref:hypothetical protein n=1 Tax=Anabaena sp. PCC 7108 TaxID=163908 RepID=UPI001181A6AC|nr:hypothetical protein [Anabaena sp. PCC 7108]